MHLRSAHVRPLVTIALLALLALPSAASAAGKITGGVKVDRTSFDSTWRSYVTVLSEPSGASSGRSQASRIRCSGVLIGAQAVLTSADCVDGAPVADRLYVVGATDSLSRDNRNFGVRANVEEIILNPQTSTLPSGVAHRHVPLAILRLAAPLPGTEIARLAAPTDAELWGNGRGAREGTIAAGWVRGEKPDARRPSGPSSSTARHAAKPKLRLRAPDELHTVGLPLLSSATCSSTGSFVGSDASEFDPETRFCMGQPKPPRGVCEQDTGGPVLRYGSGGNPVVIGIVLPRSGSYEDDESSGACSEVSLAVRVDVARPWIDAIVAQLAAGTAAPRAPLDVAVEPVKNGSAGISWSSADPTVTKQWVLSRTVDYYYGWVRALFNENVPSPFEISEHVVDTLAPEITRSRISRIYPTQRDKRLHPRIRVGVMDGFGRTSWSKPVLARPRIDMQRPSRPAAPKLAGERFGVPHVTWSSARDNDCVVGFFLIARPRGTRGVEFVDFADTAGCAPGKLARPDEYSDFSATFYDMEPGRYDVSVIAMDRAGNASVSPKTLVRVERTVEDNDYDPDLCRFADESIKCTFPLVSEDYDDYEDS